MATSAEQVRAWQGPAVLSYGFRPFFLGGAIWAALAMALWVGMLSGAIMLPSAFDPVSWHAHEFLFGYLSAVVAGFLLTAVPNWTGRLPIVGVPLGVLFALWLAGRVAVATSQSLTPALVAFCDLAMPVALAATIAREIVAGRNWRNLIILTVLLAMIVGNAVFHWEAQSGADAADGMGLRIGLAAAIMLVAVIGGRIVPSFTRNWLIKREATALPAPFAGFDRFALIVLLLALLFWIAAPEAPVGGAMLVVAGLVHMVRLARWAGYKTGGEALVWVLHLGYGFVPLGALAIGFSILTSDAATVSAAQHMWMAGAIGLMTMAVMTRATLGHTGRALHADIGTVGVYVLLVAAILLRLLAAAVPETNYQLLMVSGALWIGAFAGFVAFFGPLLTTRPRR